MSHTFEHKSKTVLEIQQWLDGVAPFANRLVLKNGSDIVFDRRNAPVALRKRDDGSWQLSEDIDGATLACTVTHVEVWRDSELIAGASLLPGSVYVPEDATLRLDVSLRARP